MNLNVQIILAFLFTVFGKNLYIEPIKARPHLDPIHKITVEWRKKVERKSKESKRVFFYSFFVLFEVKKGHTSMEATRPASSEAGRLVSALLVADWDERPAGSAAWSSRFDSK